MKRGLPLLLTLILLLKAAWLSAAPLPMCCKDPAACSATLQCEAANCNACTPAIGASGPALCDKPKIKTSMAPLRPRLDEAAAADIWRPPAAAAA